MNRRMKFLLSALFIAFLHAPSSRSVSSEILVVTQSPDQDVMEGETVNIICCWTGGFERVTVNWQKNHTDIKRDILINGLLQNEMKSGCSNLTFIKITREDSGNYTCKVSVDVPYYIVSEGSGTVIVVTAKKVNNITDPPVADVSDSNWEDVLVHVLRCLPILALVMSFFCLDWFGKKAQQRARAAAGSKVPLAERVEEDQEEEEREEGGTEAE